MCIQQSVTELFSDMKTIKMFNADYVTLYSDRLENEYLVCNDYSPGADYSNSLAAGKISTIADPASIITATYEKIALYISQCNELKCTIL